MSKWRRYLYLLLDRFERENYALLRIDASTLFFPTTNHKNMVTPAATATAGVEDARLPRPFISFIASPSDSGSRVLNFFTLFGRGKNKSLIAGADENGFTFIYDLSQHIVNHQRRLNERKQIETVSLAVGDALYVMNRSPLLPDHSRCGFESLVYDGEPSPKYLENIEDWRWRCLEPPPYVLETGYKPTRIAAYTVVGDSDIWISTPDIGTYSFNTLAGTWSKAGNWVLPFRDRAHYIPECDSWLGFSSKTGLLCSSDLKPAAGRRRTRPVVSGVLEEAMPEYDGCDLIEPYLVHLGSGKFCVAKFFEREYNQVSKDGFVCERLENFVILTGFVMELDGGGVLRMRKHRSRRYMVPSMGLGMGWVF